MAGALAAGAQPVVTKGAASFTEACGAWKTVTDIVVTEGAANDFAASQTNLTYVLGAPTGFEFKPGVGSVSKANGRDVSSVSINVTSGQITVTITTDGTPTKTDVVTISGVEMMITTATVAGSPYHVTYDAGSSSGSWNTVDGTQHADLTVSAGGTNITSNGTGGGNWNTASTWSPTQVPTECDNVTIIGSDVVTVDADVSVSDLTIGASATLTHGNNNQIDLYGSYTNNGSHLGGNGSSRLYLDGNAVAIDGTGSIGVGGGIYVEGNYDIAATAALSASKTITIDGANTVTNNGSVTTTATITGTGTWINAANATLITTSTITSGLTANAAGNLVHYNNGGNQNIKAASYANITFSGSGNKTLQGNIVVGEDLTLNSGPTLATSSYHISLAGDWINNGGNVNHSNTCILTLNGASDQKITSAGKAFYDIVVKKKGAGG